MEEIAITKTEREGRAGGETVTISGRMTIEHAGEIRSALLEAISGGDELHLDLAGVSEADLTGLQLICAAHSSSIRLNKRFAVNAGLSEPLKSIVRDAGFLRHIGCSIDISNTCVWAGGENQWQR